MRAGWGGCAEEEGQGQVNLNREPQWVLLHSGQTSGFLWSLPGFRGLKGMSHGGDWGVPS